MKRIHSRRMAAWILVLTAVFCISVTLGETVQYTENSLNYVDGSIDVTAGIPEDATGVLARIKEKGVLRIATDADYAPQEFIDPDLEGQDQYAGADMELARRIAERMGVRLEIVKMDFTDVLPAVAEGECDLAISALAYTPARAFSYTMSKGYYFSDIPKTVMVIRAEDAAGIRSVDDLQGKIIVAQRGSLQEAMVAANVISYEEFRRIGQISAVYDSVIRGTADAAAVDAETAMEYIEENPECGLVIAEGIEFPLESDYQGDRIAAKKGEYQLMYFVNGVIDEVLTEDLYTKWMEEAGKRADELGL